MAGILRSGSFLRIFSGLRQALASNTSHYEVLGAHKIYKAQVDCSILRTLTAVKPQEKSSNSISTKNFKKSLSKIDKEIRWSGRIDKRDLEVIFQDLTILESASSSQSLLLIRCCGSVLPDVIPEERTKLVQNLWSTLVQLRVPIDISHYNALLRVYVENEYKFDPSELLAELKQEDIEPNKVTFHRLIERYCQYGDIEGATQILQLMKEQDQPLSEKVFNAFIMGHARADDLESAFGILDIMREAGLEPNAETYTALLVAYAELGDIGNIRATMQDNQEVQHYVHDRELMEVVVALARRGHGQYIPEVLEMMQDDPGYNQEATKLVLRLVNYGCDEAAQQVLDTMDTRIIDERNQMPSGSFLIQQLVKVKRPGEVILRVCQSMVTQGRNVYAFETALKAALVHGQLENANLLMQTMAEQQHPIRKHYFWPFFVQYGQGQCADKIYETIGEMQKSNIPIDLESMSHYICPALLSNKACAQTEEVVIYTLKEMGFTIPFIINGLVAYHINEKDLAAAADLISRYTYRLTKNLRKDLVEAYVHSKDATSTAIVLGQMVPKLSQNLDERQTKEEGEENAKGQVDDVAGDFLVDLIFNKKINFLEPMLKAMIEHGIGINQKNASKVISKLDYANKEEIKILLELLSSNTLTQKPLKTDLSGKWNDLSIDSLENKHLELQIKGRLTDQSLKSLAVAYAKKQEVDKAEDILKEIEAKEIECHDDIGFNIIIMSMYIDDGNLEEALKYYSKFRSHHSENKLSYLQCLRLFNILISNGKYEDAIDLLHDNNQDAKEAGMFDVHKKIQDVLSTLAEKGDIGNLKMLSTSLKKYNYLPKNSSKMLSPVIEFYLHKDNLEGAMDEYEHWVKEYHLTPGKDEITKKCIEKEDTENLQKIMDLNSEIYSEINSLYELVFIFLDMGRVKQAEKILQTNGLRAHNDKLEHQLLWYYRSNNVELMENLCKVTKNLFDVDRYMMYLHLLNAYIRAGDTAKCLSLWANIQEEELTPDDDFLNRMGSFLQDNNVQVPFVFKTLENIPTVELENSDNMKSVVSTNSSNVAVIEALKKMFLKVLETRDVNRAIDLHKKIEHNDVKLGTFQESKYLELLLQNDLLDEATKHFNKMLASGTRPAVKKIRFYVQKLAEAGDVENFLKMGKNLDKDVFPLISYNNNLCRTYVKANRSDEYLAILQNEILRAESEADVQILEEKFPRGGIMCVLEENPEKIDMITNIAQEYYNRGSVIPTNCLWSYYYINEKYDEAESLFCNNLKKQEKLLFQPIIHKASQNNNKDMVLRLLSILETESSVSISSKGVVHSCLLNIICNEEKFGEALSTLKNSLEKGITLEDINHSTLQKIKSGLESCNLPFPYEIPPRRRKKDKFNSSSDSD